MHAFHTAKNNLVLGQEESGWLQVSKNLLDVFGNCFCQKDGPNRCSFCVQIMRKRPLEFGVECLHDFPVLGVDSALAKKKPRQTGSIASSKRGLHSLESGNRSEGPQRRMREVGRKEKSTITGKFC